MDLVHTDKAVAKRMLAGDEAAFREVFERLFPRLYRYALARLGGNQDDAKEVVQQTFCRAFERLDSYRGEASLYGWMCRICRNAIIDLARRQRREISEFKLHETEMTIEAITEAMLAPASDEPDQEVARGNLQRLIQATLDYLPARYGDVLEWKYVEDLSVKEIAERLDVGPKAAESLLTRARGAFREAIVTFEESNELLPEKLANLKGLAR